MICECCGKAPATRAVSRIENGVKHIVYQCDNCAQPAPETPRFQRPCAQCKKREGHIKLTRMRPTGRVVTYLCERCAQGR